jgi:lysophospholipase L1-like esterase
LPSDQSRLTVRHGDTRHVLEGATGPEGVSRYGFEAPADATIVLERPVGEPRVFGIIAERQNPGVVVDTLGINGARVDTPLAWDEGHWVGELKRRAPDLVVLAYGSNEVGDRVAPWRYAAKYRALLERARAGSPEVDCAILGLPDQAAPDWHTPRRVGEIETVQRQVARSEGCLFVSTLDAMGGQGAFRSWVEQDPPLASPDRVHLTPRGYLELGGKVALRLMPGSADKARRQ